MNDAWIGKPISITCLPVLGVFQGVIKNANASSITIVRAFRNGVPSKNPSMEVTISVNDIVSMKLLNTEQAPTRDLVTKHDGNKIQPRVSALSSKLNKAKVSPPRINSKPVQKPEYKTAPCNQQGIDIPTKSNGLHQSLTPFKTNKQKYRHFQNDQTFGTSVDDSNMHQDFDFEKNLALFDKQAIWNEINGFQKPDSARQAVPNSLPKSAKTYRHDENILSSTPIKLRQIEVGGNHTQEYVTDSGLVIPTISETIRNLIQNAAENSGLTWSRLCDNLARSICEMTIQLIGGARRLIPKNQHQWPKIVILCDQSISDRHTELGLATGRYLSSHGLKTLIYIKSKQQTSTKNIELDLYAATGNKYTNTLNDLPSSDLVILSVASSNLDANLIKWMNSNRSPVLAIDPPITGFVDFCAKCSILPILPLNGLKSSCGKLYLANLGIPERFYVDAGVKYKSPFGHKSVIPIHDAE